MSFTQIKHLHSFKTDVNSIQLPEKFTFPFFYDPHPLSEIAAKELQAYLLNQTDFAHNFGFNESQETLAIGKMFGVLVVQEPNGNLAYLAAFSGKLADSNEHIHFVPPVFDILEIDGFFKKEEAHFYELTQDIEQAERDPNYLKCKLLLEEETSRGEEELQTLKDQIKENKIKRKKQRILISENSSKSELESLLEELRKQSIKEQYYLKERKEFYKERISELKSQLAQFELKIQQIKDERSLKSADLQQQIFSKYTFLNAHGEWKSLKEIFDFLKPLNPPAGSGECAAPKLLHYAYLHNLKPICMAEFWWGKSPSSEVRKHGNFYPACRGKCEPILGHMLQGLEVEENPMLTSIQSDFSLDIVYEDDYIVAVNKPYEFLSVPGISIQDCVYERLRVKYPEATGPLLVHRLDMSTSGIILAAKNKDVHKILQRLFIKRKVQKRYVALLDGIIEENEGYIELPLRVDLDDRPRQLVCYEHGKIAKTNWEVIERKDGKTRVYFYPITGRTHQLRVHASHSLGLNCPIVGDDLYGIKAQRLYLHAEQLVFDHPIRKEKITIEVAAPF
jgi:tRNA pseudouridine32 synthase / 23S rRNA pseudouridine746 synthase